MNRDLCEFDLSRRIERILVVTMEGLQTHAHVLISSGDARSMGWDAIYFLSGRILSNILSMIKLFIVIDYKFSM